MSKSQKVDYQVWENVSSRTIVLGTDHVNVSIWCPPAIPLKLTDAEVTVSKIGTTEGFVKVTDAKKLAKAVRPAQARQSFINEKFRDTRPPEAKPDSDDPGGFNTKPQVSTKGVNVIPSL